MRPWIAGFMRGQLQLLLASIDLAKTDGILWNRLKFLKNLKNNQNQKLLIKNAQKLSKVLGSKPLEENMKYFLKTAIIASNLLASKGFAAGIEGSIEIPYCGIFEIKKSAVLKNGSILDIGTGNVSIAVNATLTAEPRAKITTSSKYSALDVFANKLTKSPCQIGEDYTSQIVDKQGVPAVYRCYYKGQNPIEKVAIPEGYKCQIEKESDDLFNIILTENELPKIDSAKTLSLPVFRKNEIFILDENTGIKPVSHEETKVWTESDQEGLESDFKEGDESKSSGCVVNAGVLDLKFLREYNLDAKTPIITDNLFRFFMKGIYGSSIKLPYNVKFAGIEIGGTTKIEYDIEVDQSQKISSRGNLIYKSDSENAPIGDYETDQSLGLSKVSGANLIFAKKVHNVGNGQVVQFNLANILDKTKHAEGFSLNGKLLDTSTLDKNIEGYNVLKCPKTGINIEFGLIGKTDDEIIFENDDVDGTVTFLADNSKYKGKIKLPNTTKIGASNGFVASEVVVAQTLDFVASDANNPLKNIIHPGQNVKVSNLHVRNNHTLIIMGHLTIGE